MTDENHLGRAIELAARKLRQSEGWTGVFIVLDADDDCPAELGPQLLELVTRLRPDVASSVVVAKAEYEAWFLGAASSLRGRGSIKTDAVAPDDPEGIRDAKGYLRGNLMVPGATYSETVDQPALTNFIDFGEASVCPSFVKLRRELDKLFLQGA